MPDTPTTELLARLERLLDLNPQISMRELDEFYALAQAVPPENFNYFSPIAERLIYKYVNAPWKRTSSNILKTYYTRLEKTSASLRHSNAPNSASSGNTRAGHSVALTGPDFTDPLTYCRILSSAHIPKTLQKAVDACQERNKLLLSVIEYMLRILHLIDSPRAFDWELEFITREEGNLDPEMVRDMLRVWREQDEVKKETLLWVLDWSHDNVLQRQWPSITVEANAVLRQHVLRSWIEESSHQGTALRHLRLILRRGPQTGKLRKWLTSAIGDFGESVDFFVSFSGAQIDSAPEEASAEHWTKAALLREVQFIQTLFIPILGLSELLLSTPNGAYHLALALFGLSGEGWQQWHNTVAQEAHTKVLALFLQAFRQGTPPAEVIRQLSFGDDQLYQAEVAELDIGTRQFGSVQQRDKVVNDLATYYNSYLESQRLPQEITRRYRKLMRVVHEDNLRRHLTPEQLQAVDWTVLREVNTLFPAARRFLSRRRALNSSVEEMTAAEMSFAQTVRERRYYILRHHLTS